MLAIFAEFEREILRDRVKAGIAQARQQGKPHGRPPTVKAHSGEIKRLFARGISKREIAKRLRIGRTSVRRVLTQKVSSLAHFISVSSKNPKLFLANQFRRKIAEALRLLSESKIGGG
jgi:DNA invertase Pin-like site-specific DNA recombinase